MTLAPPSVETAPAARPHPRRWAGPAVLSASLLLVFMDMTILNIALPAISADLRPDSVQLLWMVDVYEGFSPLQAGLRLLPAALGAGVISQLAPQLAARWGPARCWPAAWRSPAGGSC